MLGAAAPTSGPATLAVRPERIRLTRATHGTGAGGVRLAARVTEVHYLGTDTRYHLVSGSATLSVRQPNTGGQLGAEGRFAPGDEVVAWWQPDGAAVLRPE